MLNTQISKANLYGKDKIVLCNPLKLSAFMRKIREDYINCEGEEREQDDL